MHAAVNGGQGDYQRIVKLEHFSPCMARRDSQGHAGKARAAARACEKPRAGRSRSRRGSVMAHRGPENAARARAKPFAGRFVVVWGSAGPIGGRGSGSANGGRGKGAGKAVRARAREAQRTAIGIVGVTGSANAGKARGPVRESPRRVGAKRAGGALPLRAWEKSAREGCPPAAPHI